MIEAEEQKFEKRFRLFGIATIAAVFFLIFVGGLVRSTGSGLGCPDWPKCFGSYVPPTDISQLPTDYKTRFAIQGKEIADFDVFKTWTEYINRLVGVVIGFLIFLTMVFAYPYLKKDKSIFWLSFAGFLLVGFQGWIGSRVVATDLAVSMITIHMVIALLIVALLIYTVTRSQQFGIIQVKADSSLKVIMVVSLLVNLIQVISGTQVREQVDNVARALGEQGRELWPNFFMQAFIFKVHRSWSILSFALAILLLFKYRNLFSRSSLVYKSGLAMILLLGMQAFTGTVLVNLGFLKEVTAIHLTIGSLTAGLQLFLIILIFGKTKIAA